MIYLLLKELMSAEKAAIEAAVEPNYDPELIADVMQILTDRLNEVESEPHLYDKAKALTAYNNNNTATANRCAEKTT